MCKTIKIAENNFFETKKLNQMSQNEWELLCDGCGLCCIYKLQDEDTNEIFYTKVACKLLDCETVKCTRYPDRKKHNPDCIKLNYENLPPNLEGLPDSCAYKRLYFGDPLPHWHPLISHTASSVIESNNSASSFAIHETKCNIKNFKKHIISIYEN